MVATCLKTDVGKERSDNEDAIGETKNDLGHFVVVCDGMGGHYGGQLASQIALEKLLHTLDAHAEPEKFLERKPTLIQMAFERASQAIRQKANEEPQYKEMGTTAVVAWVHENQLFYGYLGDSRLYLLRNGKLHQCTKDHSYVQDLVDAGAITAEEAERHPKRNIVTRVLLAYEPLEETVSTGTLTLNSGDIVLVCSDGLNDMILADEITTILTAAPSLEQAANQLIEAANNAGGKDNISVGLLRYT